MQQRERERSRVVRGTKKWRMQHKLGWECIQNGIMVIRQECLCALIPQKSQKGYTSRPSQVSVSLQQWSTLNLLCDPFFPSQQNHFPKASMLSKPTLLKSIIHIRLQSPNSLHLILLWSEVAVDFLFVLHLNTGTKNPSESITSHHCKSKTWLFLIHSF